MPPEEDVSPISLPEQPFDQDEAGSSSRLEAGDNGPEHGSSLAGAIFNFTNVVCGAGAIGLGGAFASSGGLVSVLAIVFFAILTKVSLDLLIRLSVETEGASSYEDLGQIGFGSLGRMSIVISKFIYSSGCLVAYVVVVKDNFGSALRALLYGSSASVSSPHFLSWFQTLLGEDTWLTWTVSTLVILPLCLLRDMSPLASLSAVSIVSMFLIIFIIIYLYFWNPNGEIRHPGGSFYQHWLEVRPGFLECLGTFVFTFVSQHTVHLAFDSLKPHIRTVSTWQRVSSVSIFLAATMSLSVGIVVYMSFWEQTKSDIFQIYPAMPLIDLAKLLLCITMILTFPLPFFTCRELLIILLYAPLASEHPPVNSEGMSSDLREPLLEEGAINEDLMVNEDGIDRETASVSSARNGDGDPESVMERESIMDLSVLSAHAINLINSCLLPGEERQLKLPYHVALTVKLWFVVTGLAIAAPNLGDVLDLVGCASGTLIAFIFPACLAFRLEGFTATALFILCIGGIVGVVGTFYSLKQLVVDIAR